MGRDLFTDYDGFIEKFKPKKTTDDCYTPEVLYNAIVGWVRGNCNIEGCDIIRPFYPGGDYENHHYPKNCVVVDNPPFSIFAKIIAYYNLVGVKYFLFSPHLTLFSPRAWCTRIVVGVDIKYENGAAVKTSFVSNLFGEIEILGSPELRKLITDVQKSQTTSLPKYKYPENVVTVSRVCSLVTKGVSIAIPRQKAMRVSTLLSQRRGKAPGIFGGGYLVSNGTAKEITAKEIAAKEITAKEITAKEIAAKEIVIEWPLMEQEKLAIQQLDAYM